MFFVRYFAIFCTLFSSVAAGDTQQMDRAANKWHNRVKTSGIMVRISDGKILWQKNPNRPMIPASVQKLVTSSTLLDRYGIGYKIQTDIKYTGLIDGFGVLKGDIYVIGAGDPYIVSEKMWQMAADIKNLGIRKITGNVIIDGQLFSGPKRNIARKHGKLASSHSYDAPISSFGVNFNTVAVAVAPNTRNGKLIASLDPLPLKNVDIDSNHQNGKLAVIRRSQNGREVLHVKGNPTQASTKLKKIYRSVGDSTAISGNYFISFLEQAGIQIDGKVLTGSTPPSAKTLYKLEGYPMPKLIHGINHYSNNYIADVLTAKLGADFNGHGDLLSGSAVIKEFIKKANIPTEKLIIEDGSGLKNSNRMSAKQCVSILYYMTKRFDIFPEFLASIPSAGVTGTVKNRLKHPGFSDLTGKVRAKTGTHTQPQPVVSLAGYLNHPKHGTIAFTLFHNGRKGAKTIGVKDLHRLDHEILHWAMLKL